MPDIFINTERPVDRSIVAGINQPQREAPAGAFVAGSSYDTNIYFVLNDGTYDAASGQAGQDVQVAISTIGKPQSGTFTLTDGTDTTAAIEYGASAQAVEDALNALNTDTGPFADLVDVVKQSDTQYAITFRTLGAQTVLSGSTVSLFPESTPTASIAVDGDGTTYAQQIIELTRQPAIYQQTWSTIANGFNGTLALNTTRLLQSLVLEPDEPFYLEVKLNGETVAREVVGVEHSTMPASAFSGAAITNLLDAFAADPTSNANFNAAAWAAEIAAGGTVTSVNGEVGVVVLDMDDFAETATNKILTTAERTKLGDQVLTDVIDKMAYNADDLTFDINTGVGVVVQIGQELLVKARNVTGVTISNGAVVRINGASGDRPTITPAQADSLANISGVIGIVTADILNNAVGFVTVHGLVRGLDTSTYTEGDELFLSDSVAGGFTSTEPSLSIPVGTVTFANPASGELFANVDNQKHLLEFASDPTLIGNFSAATWKTELAIAAADLTATGTPSATTYLRGDNTWATVAGGGGDLLAANNLSDVANAATSLSNLGGLASTDIDTLAELNTIVGDATLIDTADARLSDSRTPTAHAASHTDGTDDIQDATNAVKGLATAAQITALEANTAARHDAVTIAASGGRDYVTISGTQQLTLHTVDLTADVSGDLPVADGGTGASDAATARTNLGVDAAGTDNSTDVTLAGEDFLSLAGQQITANAIDLDNLSATGTPSGTTFLRGDNTWATPAGGGGGGLTLVDKTADANITAVTGEMHVVEMNSGTPFTASRNWTLPVAASVATGDQFGLMIKDGDTAFEVNVRTGATGDLLNGVDVSAASNEWELFQAGEVLIITCVDGATGDYIVERDGRIACKARIHRDATSGALSIPASAFTLFEFPEETYNNGLITDITTNYDIEVRRSGVYNLNSQITIDGVIPTTTTALLAIFKNGRSTRIGSAYNVAGDGSGVYHTVYNYDNIELVAGDALSMEVVQTSGAARNTLSIDVAPNFFSLTEIL